MMTLCCFVENISLAPRFNAVEDDWEGEKPFKRLSRLHEFYTQLKPGVNEKVFYKATLRRSSLRFVFVKSNSPRAKINAPPSSMSLPDSAGCCQRGVHCGC